MLMSVICCFISVLLGFNIILFCTFCEPAWKVSVLIGSLEYKYTESVQTPKRMWANRWKNAGIWARLILWFPLTEIMVQSNRQLYGAESNIEQEFRLLKISAFSFLFTFNRYKFLAPTDAKIGSTICEQCLMKSKKPRDRLTRTCRGTRLWCLIQLLSPAHE